MEKILIINTLDDFAERIQAEFNAKNIQSERLRSRESILIIDNSNQIKFFNKNAEISLDNARVFLRVRGHDSHFCSLLIKIFLHRNIPFNDPVNAEHSNSSGKITQTILLSQNGIPVPKTIVCNSESFYNNEKIIMDNISFPCVLKTGGSRGDRVWLIEDKEKLTKMLFKFNSLYVIQEYIENTYDMRILVYKNEIIGAIKRIGMDNFHNNVSKGASVESAELTKEEEDLAIEAARISGIDFAGVDILRGPTGPVILEVNQGPQVDGFESFTGINVPSEIAKRIAEI